MTAKYGELHLGQYWNWDRGCFIIIKCFIGIKNWINLLFTVDKDAYVIIQHPNENILVANKFINVCKRIKKCKFITLIHDLESLRQFVFKNGSTKLYNRSHIADEALLKKSDYIISHNKKMTKYLIIFMNVIYQILR